jgi:hypothetical protein
MARPAARPTRPTSLSGWLRERSDDQLATLVTRRPDLGLPAPADIATLASRVSVRSSVQRAVDGLTAWQLHVLDALALSCDPDVTATPGPLAAIQQPPGSGPDAATAARLLGRDELGPALDDLFELALLWGDVEQLHFVAGVREALGTYPAGLGRPAAQLFAAVSDTALVPVLRTLGLPAASQPRAGLAVAAVLSEPGRRDELLAACDTEERDVLAKLAAGPPIGLLRGGAPPDSYPPHRLMSRGLLVPIDAQTVELPRELGMALRGSHPLGQVPESPPTVEILDRSPADADRAGTSAVLELTRLIEALGEAWSAQPPAVLRGGGLGVRELRRTARELGVGEPSAALLIEAGAAAGLIASSNGVEPSFLPTSEFDLWRRREPAQRWVTVATAWLTMTRQPSLAGQRDDKERPITVLGPDAERGTLPALRRHTLSSLLTLPPGAAPARRTDLLDRLTWAAPRRAGAQRRLVEAILDEADLVGITSAGGLTGYGRAVLAGSASAAEDALAIALPTPVGHVLVQPDLTVVVPGPPVPELARELELVADLESSGGASVYRITEATVRRALDAGRTAAELSAMFETTSRTPVPQALSYLIDDVGRRHGVLRAGVASAYLRCDDEALLSRVLAQRSVEQLGLRRLAPTVAISSAPVARILDVLRAAGYAPAAESPDGGVLSIRAEAPRAPSRPTSRLVRLRPADEAGTHAAELVRRMRAGDSLSELARRSQPIGQSIPGVTSASTLGLLRDAIRAGSTIWLGFVNADGNASQHTILPISMAAGVLRGHEPSTRRLQSFPLHRITAVS